MSGLVRNPPWAGFWAEDLCPYGIPARNVVLLKAWDISVLCSVVPFQLPVCSSISHNSFSCFSHWESDPSEVLQWPLDSLGVELLWGQRLKKEVLLALKQADCFKLKRVFLEVFSFCPLAVLRLQNATAIDLLQSSEAICTVKYCSDFFFSPLTLFHNNTLFLHASFLLTNSIVPLKVMKAKATELHNQHMAVPFVFNEIYDSKWTNNVPV